MERVVAAADQWVVAGVLAAVVVAAVVWRLRGGGGDPLERLGRWAASRGLAYVPSDDPARLATFVGDVGAHRVEVAVTRAPRGFGVDLPPRVTTVTASARGDVPGCTVQPAAWVMDVDGRGVGPALATGDSDFDAAWAVRPGLPNAADDVARVVTPAMRARLLEPNAAGLAVRLSPGAVETLHPGIVTEVLELDRRLALVCDLASLLER